ncbi:hypothetical protein Taro_002351, partial [Colocasia esculenta]|nr:hypothetical protein [Colocasia esculenta]
ALRLPHPSSRTPGGNKPSSGVDPKSAVGRAYTRRRRGRRVGTPTMDLQPSEFDRLVIFEHARMTAQANYARNPLDAENLTTWGGALLELAQLQSGPECVNMVKEAVSRLEEALEISPRKHDTLWCLGNAHTAQAFLTTDQEMAKMYFTRAVECFQRAASEDPGNELYLQSLKVTEKVSLISFPFFPFI